jgi:hypothetical protein
MAAFLLPMKEARSTTNLENIEEIIAAESSAEWATLGGQQQYFTPESLTQYCVTHLPHKNPLTVIDPECDEGALVKGVGGWGTIRYGIDIDNPPKRPKMEAIRKTQRQSFSKSI